MEKLLGTGDNWGNLCGSTNTLSSTYNEVAFNENSAITKQNLHTKYTPFTYYDVTFNEKLPIMRQNLCIFFFVIGRAECTVAQEKLPHTYLQATSVPGTVRSLYQKMRWI